MPTLPQLPWALSGDRPLGLPKIQQERAPVRWPVTILTGSASNGLLNVFFGFLLFIFLSIFFLFW